MDALEQLVTRMEAGDLALEESLREYQRGMELVRSCEQALDEAQRRIESAIEEPAASSLPNTSDHNDSTKVQGIADADDVPF